MKRQNVRAQQHSKYLNYQNKEIKARGTKNMSIITDVNRVPEIISKESPKESKYCEKPKEWLKRTVRVVGKAISNGMDEKLIFQKELPWLGPFQGH